MAIKQGDIFGKLLKPSFYIPGAPRKVLCLTNKRTTIFCLIFKISCVLNISYPNLDLDISCLKIGQKLTDLRDCWFHGSSFKGFSIVFLLPDWLKLNHLKSRMECDFSDIFRAIFVPP